jgi:predicted RNA binding protein YcfA (HicA-like mRNA interferase family)
VKLPRDLSGEDLAKALACFGYVVDRQTGSHITVPAYNPLKVGTLSAILRDVADHFGLNRDELLS